MNNLNPADLTDIERAILAIIAAGLAPSSVAGDRTLRLDYLTAVTVATLRGEEEDALLAPDGQASAAVQQEASIALYDLADRRVISLGSRPVAPLLNVDREPSFAADRNVAVNFDDFPNIFDRYLAGRCLDEVLRNPAAYRFIMGKYADSSEIWQRVYRQGT
jgi:hypothetical protein